MGSLHSSPSGYNNVVTSIRNEQSLEAYDGGSGYVFGTGRVETKIRVGGAGTGTVRVYYGLDEISCSSGYSLDIAKVSGNVSYPFPSVSGSASGYLDVTISGSDRGGFILYTRCKTAGSYIGNYGINSVWYSLVPGGETGPTATPAPTACTTICFYQRCSSAAMGINSKLSMPSKGLIFAINNFDRIDDQAALLYRVRDEILSTSTEGQRYIDVYYEHSAEIAMIMNSNPEIAEQGLDVIDALTPNLQALLDGQGNTMIVTSEQVQQAQDFLDAILPYASPALQQTIEYERLRQPLEQFIGVTMDEALVYVEDGLSATATPSPTMTPTLSPTSTPTNTPSPTSASTNTATPTNTPVLYAFTGFFPPVDNQPVINIVKAGSAVPIKFSLGGDQGLDIFPPGYPTSAVVACGSAVEDAIEQTVTASASGLAYDAPADQYIYTWKTDKAWADSCRTFVIKLKDGTFHRINFKFK